MMLRAYFALLLLVLLSGVACAPRVASAPFAVPSPEPTIAYGPTPTTIATAKATATVFRTATSTIAPTPTETVKPTITTAPTPTARPTLSVDGIPAKFISDRMAVLLRGALARLKGCSPELYAYVHAHIRGIEDGPVTGSWSNGTIDVSEPSFFDDWLPANLKEFHAMTMFAHESRHMEQPGQGRDEADANRFALQVFDACAYTTKLEDRWALDRYRAAVEEYANR